MARAGWVGDYVDPFTFLSQFYTQKNDSSTGWWNPKYDKLLEEANNIADPMKRFEKIAEAEYLMITGSADNSAFDERNELDEKALCKRNVSKSREQCTLGNLFISKPTSSKWDENVDNIMKNSDPQVDSQIGALMKSQEEFEKSKSDGRKKKIRKLIKP